MGGWTRTHIRCTRGRIESVLVIYADERFESPNLVLTPYTEYRLSPTYMVNYVSRISEMPCRWIRHKENEAATPRTMRQCSPPLP